MDVLERAVQKQWMQRSDAEALRRKSSSLAKIAYLEGILTDREVLDLALDAGFSDATITIMSGGDMTSLQKLLSVETSMNYGVVLFDRDEQGVDVAMLDPSDVAAAAQITSEIQQPLRLHACRPKILMETISSIYDIDELMPRPREQSLRRAETAFVAMPDLSDIAALFQNSLKKDAPIASTSLPAKPDEAQGGVRVALSRRVVNVEETSVEPEGLVVDSLILSLPESVNENNMTLWSQEELITPIMKNMMSSTRRIVLWKVFPTETMEPVAMGSNEADPQLTYLMSLKPLVSLKTPSIFSDSYFDKSIGYSAASMPGVTEQALAKIGFISSMRPFCVIPVFNGESVIGLMNVEIAVQEEHKEAESLLRMFDLCQNDLAEWLLSL